MHKGGHPTTIELWWKFVGRQVGNAWENLTVVWFQEALQSYMSLFPGNKHLIITFLSTSNDGFIHLLYIKYPPIFNLWCFLWKSNDASRLSNNLAYPLQVKLSIRPGFPPKNEEKHLTHLAPLEMAKIPWIPYLKHMATKGAILELSHSSLQGWNVHTDFWSNILPIQKLSNIMYICIDSG